MQSIPVLARSLELHSPPVLEPPVLPSETARRPRTSTLPPLFCFFFLTPVLGVLGARAVFGLAHVKPYITVLFYHRYY